MIGRLSLTWRQRRRGTLAYRKDGVLCTQNKRELCLGFVISGIRRTEESHLGLYFLELIAISTLGVAFERKGGRGGMNNPDKNSSLQPLTLTDKAEATLIRSLTLILLHRGWAFGAANW